jgi:hypothetical protein
MISRVINSCGAAVAAAAFVLGIALLATCAAAMYRAW